MGNCKIIIRYSSIALIFLLTACNAYKELCKEKDPIKQLVVDHAALQKKRNGLELVALSTPEPGKQGRYYIHYLVNRPVDIKDVRKMIVELTEPFLSAANQCPATHKPVAANDLIVNLGFVKEDRTFYEPPAIAYAYLKNGTIHYCYYDNLFGKFISHEDVKEPYFEAKNIICNEHEATP